MAAPGRPYLLHQLLERAALTYPDHEAVRCDGASLSYAELDGAAGGLAHALRAAGVRRGDRVGICLPKSVEAIAGVYGTLKAGAAYVPLDHKTPARRLAVVADDCELAALITTPVLAAALVPLLTGGLKLLVLLDDGTQRVDLGVPTTTYSAAAAAAAPASLDAGTIDEDLAYVLYTSGSTGTPKGVMLTHRNALTFVEWCADAIGVDHRDRFSNHAPLTFDLSVFDLYVAAYGGATLVLVPEDHAYFGSALATLIDRERITVWYSVPSALVLLMKTLEEPGAFPALRAVVFAGEVFPTKHLRRLRGLLPDAALWNLYGPTETNVCTFYRVDGDLPPDDRTIPIGRACANTDVFAIRADGAVAGVDEEGELHVRGGTVMKGYWGRPETTAEVLIPDPTSGPGGGLVYRTGDLVRLRADGDYDFLGRRDHQIKSRGYRIELGDIEAALQAHQGLADAAVVAVPHERWGNEIVAYVVPVEGAALSATAVKRHVLERLPRYMVPGRVEVVAELPRTLTGKIDRTRLAKVEEA